ncbi:DUF262 domain-containing protein [Saccharicrinis sp. FJH2]|uniref:DUF262 domain-containing protein n=1 Tax=Saccharicrinis sp. FJH65 TaxID=3344659 RepID=UPI0035F3E827
MVRDIYKEAEEQIIEKQKIVDYDIKEFTIELITQKYLVGAENDENDIFIPAYQRNFVWDEERQAKFIESILLGIPIPYIFTADVEDGRLEIVDGSQRLRTIVNFIENNLILTKLEILDKLNGFKYANLSIARQRKFKNSTIRMIALSDKSDEDVRFMMFERINTGSDLLKDMEKRKGIFGGKFIEFIYKECSVHPLFIKHTSFTDKVKRRGEPQELILRFFAFSDEYREFKTGMNAFLNQYTEKRNKKFDRNKMFEEFDLMLKFVDTYIPNAFKKTPDSQKTPRVRFEAIAVGINLALRERPNLKPKNLNFLESPKFIKLVTGGSHNTPSNVKDKINFVKDNLLL